MNIFFIGILILFFSGVLSFFVSKKIKTIFVAVLGSIGLTLTTYSSFYPLWNKLELTKTINGFFNPLFQNVTFSIDLLSSIFVATISLIGILTLIYANGYLKHYQNSKNFSSHIMFLTTLITSMLLVVTCQNALVFLICWEIMSLSSFFLVVFESEKKEVLNAGIKYLVFMHISVIFIILAFATCSIASGSFSFNDFREILANNTHLANVVFALFFCGFATKAGLVPFHNWLPDAHPMAPTHISAIMSGVMIKTGIYGIIRTITLIGTPSKLIAYCVLIIAILSALYGVLYAISQHDLKKLLAYSSIENIGIISLGIAVGMLGMTYNSVPVAMLGFAGALLHVINHAIFKALLFFSTGNVYLQTHTKNIETLGGLMKKMPKTGIMFLIGCISICALPPFNGFISEFLIYISLLSGLTIHNFFMIPMLIFAISALAFVGTKAILCFSKVYSITFLGNARTQNAQKVEKDCETSCITPLYILALFSLAIGVLPQIIFKYIQAPSATIIENCKEFSIVNLIDVNNYLTNCTLLMQIISITALLLIIFALTMIAIKHFSTKGKIQTHETWGCGYNKPNAKMQYSASSYASPFLTVQAPLFKKVYDIEKPRHLFPKSAHFATQTEDFEEAYFINPLVKFDEWFLSRFETIQSGNIQSYIKYSLIFLLVIIIGSFFIG